MAKEMRLTRLEVLRRQRGMTQADLAGELDLSIGTIHRMESKPDRNTWHSTAKKLTDFFGDAWSFEELIAPLPPLEEIEGLPEGPIDL